MKILVTGANGFIGKNLVAELRNQGYCDLYLFDIDQTREQLKRYTQDCAFVFHLAGVNRPKHESEYMQGNLGLTGQLLELLKENGNRAPLLMSSSIQAELCNPYGNSKKAAEELLFSYERETGVPVFIYRLPNVFGKWCRPNYNSVVATFCDHIAHGRPITIHAADTLLRLVYIDDVISSFLAAMKGEICRDRAFCKVPVEYYASVGDLARRLYFFHDQRQSLNLPAVSDPFEKALYSTYLSYLPENGFCYPVKMHSDDRGSFTELIKTAGSGQFSVNITKPGITKGNHWHHTKCEKFIVVSGTAVIRLRRIGTGEILTYQVSGAQIEVVDIPPGYTHAIINTGDTELITFMWANEIYDPSHPDTYYEPVEQEANGSEKPQEL